MATVHDEFGARLRELRTVAGLSQEKLASVAGLDRTFVSKVERGVINISLANIDRLAAALDVSIGEFFPSRPTNAKK